MSVKEILQSLVDDDLVDSDRIGTSNYFWAFPSKASNIVSATCMQTRCLRLLIRPYIAEETKDSRSGEQSQRNW